MIKILMTDSILHDGVFYAGGLEYVVPDDVADVFINSTWCNVVKSGYHPVSKSSINPIGGGLIGDKSLKKTKGK